MSLIALLTPLFIIRAYAYVLTVQAAGCWDDSRRISRSSGSGVTSSSKGNSVRGSQEELLVLAGVRTQERSANIIVKP